MVMAWTDICLPCMLSARDLTMQVYWDCMNGKGLDRHLFALYVISTGLDYVSIQGLYEWQGPGQTSVCLVCYQ